MNMFDYSKYKDLEGTIPNPAARESAMVSNLEELNKTIKTSNNRMTKLTWVLVSVGIIQVGILLLQVRLLQIQS
jgi:hypothetical protein